MMFAFRVMQLTVQAFLASEMAEIDWDHFEIIVFYSILSLIKSLKVRR